MASKRRKKASKQTGPKRSAKLSKKKTPSLSNRSEIYASVYITAPDRETALKIAQTTVEEKLVACFNIIESTTSIYSWKNELEKVSEVILIGKTKARLKSAVIKRVKELHPYKVPCIVVWNISEGYSPYLKWLKASTL